MVRKKIDAEDEVSCQYPILLPEHILRYLEEIGIGTSTSTIQEYWAQHREHGVPWATNHPSDGHHVPLGLYGDAAKYGENNTTKVWGIYMNLVLFRPASVRLSRFLLFAIDHEASFGIRTLFPLLSAVVNNLNELFHDGRLGNKYAVTEIRGDWEFMYMVFRMTKFWNSSSLCWRCHASRGLKDPPQTCYLDMRDNPGWKATEHQSHQDFLNWVIPNAGPRSH